MNTIWEEDSASVPDLNLLEDVNDASFMKSRKNRSKLDMKTLKLGQEYEFIR